MYQIYITALAILPGLLITAYIYWRDRHEPEPIKLLVICFFFGILSTYPAIKMEEFGIYDLGIIISKDPWMTFTFAFMIIAFSEELVKYIFLRYYIYPNKEFCEPMDGIVYSVTISMGFATWENVLYVLIRPEDLQEAMRIGHARIFTAVPAHAAFAMTMGYFTGLAKFVPKRESLYLFFGLGGAVLLHGLYDFFIFSNLKAYAMYYTYATLILSIIIGKFMIHWHLKNSPYHPSQELDTLPEEGQPPPPP